MERWEEDDPRSRSDINKLPWNEMTRREFRANGDDSIFRHPKLHDLVLRLRLCFLEMSALLFRCRPWGSIRRAQLEGVEVGSVGGW